MGTWGAGPFENDEGADWAWEFEQVDPHGGIAIIRTALQSVAEVDASTYLESDQAALAVMARTN